MSSPDSAARTAAPACLLAPTAALALALAGVPVATSAQELPATDPYAIYDRAREAWRAQAPPDFVRYTIVVSYRIGERTTMRTHAGLYRQSDGRAFVKAISSEESESGYRPHGLNVRVLGTYQVSAPEFFEPFGVPELSPFFSFGMRAGIGPAPKGAETAGSLREIGRVSVAARIYTITLAGVEACDGSDAFHLRLTPLRKPDQYPLRDLWIQTSNAATCKLHVDPNFAESPSGRGAWEVTFTQANAFGTAIAEERPLHTIVFSGKTLSDVRISFSQLAAAKPDVMTNLWQLDLSHANSGATREPDER